MLKTYREVIDELEKASLSHIKRRSRENIDFSRWENQEKHEKQEKHEMVEGLHHSSFIIHICHHAYVIFHFRSRFSSFWLIFDSSERF